ncbi:MAG: pyruvate, phosphate dikinase [Rhodospirillaceae bacterium]|nr:pyruvate, phosphate dikinase [Rhodospirillaceae bacterium]
MAQWVFSFGDGWADGDAAMQQLLGGKGANLAEMSALGLPVPPGFTVTTEVCAHYYSNNKTYPNELRDQVSAALAKIEAAIGASFGDATDPLLISVRSGGRASMPGMMDTVLNLGLNDETVAGLAARSGDERFAYDSYRRFIQIYSDVVLGVDHYQFEELLEIFKEGKKVELDAELEAEDLKRLVAAYKEAVRAEIGRDFPQDPTEQLWGAVDAVFGSWMNQRAITYRRMHNIPPSWGTAINVQTMVFGNMGDDCATGVAFTRNPSTGENNFYGEFLVNAQGEDVVAGNRTPQPLTVANKAVNNTSLPAMEEVMPHVFGQLEEVGKRLETHYCDMQDIEFTVEKGRLYILQTRSGKRTTNAAMRIAVEMANSGLITRDDALLQIEPSTLDQLLHPHLDPKAKRNVIATGLPASPGAVSGRVVFTADDAERSAHKDEKVVLVRKETSPEDIHGMHAAQGILTTRGGMTSHAAVVARGMGRPCVSGAGRIQVDQEAESFFINDVTIARGDWITIDGSTGEVMLGQVPTVEPALSRDFATLMAWADERRRLGVRANAETPEDTRTARRFGAEGIGLCRTEHMFFEIDRIVAMREMILADEEKARRAALAKILPMQRTDFEELFRIMQGLPVTIRLLDPPLHEFLPQTNTELVELAESLGTKMKLVRNRALQLREANPMLGHRGYRLAISYPEIPEMQARAIFEAACNVSKELGQTVIPELMIPLAATKIEIEILKEVIDRVAGEVRAETGVGLEYSVGTMIELPRAALRAGEIAETANFLNFGTNDLTQTTFGISRDDVGSFLGNYQELGVIEADPLVSLNPEGVGELITQGSQRGRATRPDLKVGICGEHGGDPLSITFCETIGLDYVSCSPYRVPIARLAAAQAAIRLAKCRAGV